MKMKQNHTYFETIKCDDFEVFNLDYHKRRMANTTGINFNLEEYIYPLNGELLKCRVVYNRDEILDISYAPYSPREIKSFKLIFDNDIEYKYKSTDRDKIDQLFSLKEDCDEIIIVKNDLITDTSIANIAIYTDGNWYTPKTPLLPGTTRQRYLDEGKIKEKDIDVNLFKSAEKIALLNAMVDFRVIEDFNI